MSHFIVRAQPVFSADKPIKSWTVLDEEAVHSKRQTMW